MTLGKRMILEQGGGRGQTAEVESIGLGNLGILRLRSSFAVRETATPLRMTGGWVGPELQLPSLLARFQLMSSPMVELVLETGCL